jgi:hypothetical protein
MREVRLREPGQPGQATLEERKELASARAERDYLREQLGEPAPERGDAQYHRTMEALADIFVGRKLESGADEQTRERRRQARAVFGLGRAALRETR